MGGETAGIKSGTTQGTERPMWESQHRDLGQVLKLLWPQQTYEIEVSELIKIILEEFHDHSKGSEHCWAQSKSPTHGSFIFLNSRGEGE